jgi:hypothetical protein
MTTLLKEDKVKNNLLKKIVCNYEYIVDDLKI